MGLGVLFVFNDDPGGYFRAHKLNSSHGRARNEQQRRHRTPGKHQLELSSEFRMGPFHPAAGRREAVTSLDWGVNTNDSWN